MEILEHSEGQGWAECNGGVMLGTLLSGCRFFVGDGNILETVLTVTLPGNIINVTSLFIKSLNWQDKSCAILCCICFTTIFKINYVNC